MRGFRLPPAIKAGASTQHWTSDFQGTRSFHQNRDCLRTPGFPSRKELTAAIKAGLPPKHWTSKEREAFIKPRLFAYTRALPSRKELTAAIKAGASNQTLDF